MKYSSLLLEKEKASCLLRPQKAPCGKGLQMSQATQNLKPFDLLILRGRGEVAPAGSELLSSSQLACRLPPLRVLPYSCAGKHVPAERAQGVSLKHRHMPLILPHLCLLITWVCEEMYLGSCMLITYVCPVPTFIHTLIYIYLSHIQICVYMTLLTYVHTLQTHICTYFTHFHIFLLVKNTSALPMSLHSLYRIIVKGNTELACTALCWFI